MIPKRIHYIWFGGAELPDDAKRCIESWRECCPGYEIVRWDETNFDVFQNQYVREAYEAQKWAFVSDYARLWVLVNYGGVYLDTDVELIKPIDFALEHHAFSGFESNRSVPTGIMACESGFPLFVNLLHDYEQRSFILNDGTFDLTTNVVAITNACLRRGLALNNTYQEIEGLALYPSDWFCPKSHDTGEINLTNNTCAIHHFSGSWLDETEKELIGQRSTFIKSHPRCPHLLAGALVRLEHGFKSGDFSPFLSMLRLYVRERRLH